MAKVAFSKLNAKVNTDIKSISVDDKVVEVRQYLTVDEKLDLLARVIELAHDTTNNFSNPLKTEVYFIVETIVAYTNISFTEKQLENPQKLYDALLSSGWVNQIFDKIPDSEMEILRTNLEKTQNAFYTYRNSMAGILETISTDYSDLDLDITELQKKLANGENIELVKNIVNKMG